MSKPNAITVGCCTFTIVENTGCAPVFDVTNKSAPSERRVLVVEAGLQDAQDFRDWLDLFIAYAEAQS